MQLTNEASMVVRIWTKKNVQEKVAVNSTLFDFRLQSTPKGFPENIRQRSQTS